MSKGGRFLKQTPKKPVKKGGKAVKILLCVLAALLLVALIGGVIFYNSVLNKINRAEVEEKDYTMTPEIEQMMGIMETEETTQATTEAPTEATTIPTTPLEPDALNVLIVGQSARAGEESRLADTIILVTVNKNTKQVTLTSFLRDTYVKLPDYKGHTCGKNRINTCYALGYVWGGTGGAMEMTNLCLKNNFGIEVDYNVEIDFDAFSKIIDVLGGVRIPLTDAELKYLEKEGFTTLSPGQAPGEYRLFGYEALAYARMRKAEGDSDSDIKRTARQRLLMQEILNKLKRKGVSAVQDLADEILPMITTNMTNAQITECLVELLPLLPEITIETGTAPVSNDVLKGSQWAEYKELPDGGAYVQVFDQNKNMEYFKTLTEGLITVLPEPTAETTGN